MKAAKYAAALLAWTAHVAAICNTDRDCLSFEGCNANHVCFDRITSTCTDSTYKEALWAIEHTDNWLSSTSCRDSYHSFDNTGYYKYLLADYHANTGDGPTQIITCKLITNVEFNVYGMDSVGNTACIMTHPQRCWLRSSTKNIVFDHVCNTPELKSCWNKYNTYPEFVSCLALDPAVSAALPVQRSEKKRCNTTFVGQIPPTRKGSCTEGGLIEGTQCQMFCNDPASAGDPASVPHRPRYNVSCDADGIHMTQCANISRAASALTSSSSASSALASPALLSSSSGSPALASPAPTSSSSASPSLTSPSSASPALASESPLSVAVHESSTDSKTTAWAVLIVVGSALMLLAFIGVFWLYPGPTPLLTWGPDAEKVDEYPPPSATLLHRTRFRY